MLRSPTTVAGSSSGALQQNITEIIQLLESNNINVIEETSNLVRDSLSSTAEPWLLNGLVDYYIQSGNVLVQRLLTGIRQPQDKNLLSKIDEYLQKPATRYSALNLFGHIVRKDPSWIHHTVQSRAFATILKCLQLDNDVAVLTVALYVVATLIPKVPTQVSSSLNHLFGIYIRLTEWKYTKSLGNSLNEANFNTGLYALFVCLYGMYPCSFINHLQQYYCKAQSPIEGRSSQPLSASTVNEGIQTEQEKLKIFHSCIDPMLRQVQVHPNLILNSQRIEVLNERWRKMESHDILAEISDLQFSTKEEITKSTKEQIRTDSASEVGLPQSNARSELAEASVDEFDEEMMKLEAGTESCSIWSPSMELGLSTPPPSRSISPSHSQNLEHDSKKKYDHDSAQNDTLKSKGRPNVLSLPAFVNRGLSDSTPSTPTQGMVSFEFEKGDEQSAASEASNHFLTPNKKADSLYESPGVRDLQQSQNDLKFSTQLVIASSSGDDAFVDITCDSQTSCIPTLAAQGESCITEFSPALQPSSENLNRPNPVPISSGPQTHPDDSNFIKLDKPMVEDILQLPNKRSSLSLSPDELLQREIQLSVENEGKHDWLYSSHFPLSSKEARTVRATILQLQCALLYEQHRRKQHATRARRLMRKIYESSALEEKNTALVYTISQKEAEVKQMQLIMKTQKEGFRSQMLELQHSLETAEKKISELADELKVVTAENLKLKGDKEKDMNDLKQERTAAKQAKSDMYKYKLQLETEMKNRETISDLNEQIVQLQRELLIVEELSRKMEEIDKTTRNFKLTETAKYEMLIDSYKRESDRLHKALNEKSTQYDFMKGKAEEMEKRVEKKDRLLAEQKKYLENVKSLARSQIQAMEAKYQAQKNITKHMELQVMEQYSKLAMLEGHQPSEDRMSQSKSKPIQPHSLGLQSQYGHLMEASPELSPPVKSLLYQDAPVATSELEASTGTAESNN